MKKLSKNILEKHSTNNIFRQANKFGDRNISFNFKDGIKSVDLPNHYFINYINKGDKIYCDFAKRIFARLRNGSIDLDVEFERKMIRINADLKIKLDDIHRETYFYIGPNLPFLYRLKKRGNERFQIYYYEENHQYIIIFVDLYHLIIPAPNKERKETVANPKYYYEQVSNTGKCLSELIS